MARGLSVGDASTWNECRSASRHVDTGKDQAGLAGKQLRRPGSWGKLFFLRTILQRRLGIRGTKGVQASFCRN